MTWLTFFRQLVGLTLGASVYAAAGLTVGGLAAMTAALAGKEPFWFLLGGYLLPFGPLYWWFSRPSYLQGQLTFYRNWLDQGVITRVEYAAIRRELLRWHRERLFGRALEEPPPPPAGEAPTRGG
jgi:hypothetical protein